MFFFIDSSLIIILSGSAFFSFLVSSTILGTVCVDPTRSTGRRDSLLKWKENVKRKCGLIFEFLKNPSQRKNGFALESPLTFIFIFKWGKPSKNKKTPMTPVWKKKAVCEN